MKYLPVIIILVLILAVVLAVYLGVTYLRNKTREFSRALFGTSDISRAAEQMKQEYSATPKSVSAMTSLLLPKIIMDFPDFQYDEMKERAENILTSFLRAVTEHRPSLLQDGSKELRDQLENHIQMLSAQELQEHFHQIRIHRTEISQYKKTEGRCRITFQSALECYHYKTKDGDHSNTVREGSREYKYQTKYNIDLIYIQDRNLVENETDNAIGLNCPNCGAPISALGAKTCDYCGTPVIEINIHAWAFSNIDEVS